MATKFLDGPAKGVRMSLRRSPMFIRVVRRAPDVWDALDQLADEPKPGETVVVYRLVSRDGGAFLDYRDSRGRRCGHFEPSATYALAPAQPDAATARDTAAWQAWCQAQVKEETTP